MKAQTINRKGRSAIFMASLEKIARTLANKFDIQVVFEGNQCKCLGRTITLPVIPEGASDEFLNAVQGFLDHEVGHVIHSLEETPAKARNKKEFLLLDSLEDARIEHLMKQMWSGCGLNLHRMNGWLIEKIFAPGKWESLPLFVKWSTACNLIASTDSRLRELALEKFREDPELMAAIDKVAHLIPTVHDCKDSDEVLELTRKMLDEIEEEEDPEDENDPDGDAGESGEGEDDSDESESGGEGGEGEDGEGDGEDDDSDCESGGSQQESSDEPGENEDSEGSGSSGESEEDEEGGEGSAKAQAPSFADVTDEELEKSEKDTVKGLIESEVDQMHAGMRGRSDREYLIYTTKDDVIEPISKANEALCRETLLETRSMVRGMTNRLRRALLSRAQAHTLRAQVRGRLDGGRLHHLMLGTSRRIFKQTIDGATMDDAVGIWVDHSGSMNGHKLKLAAKTAMVLGEILDSLKVPFEVVGYSTTDYGTGLDRYYGASDSDKSLFTRWGNLWLGEYKTFEEPWRVSRKRVANMSNNCHYNTFDGESVRIGASRLLLRPESRKILFVLNDGYPCPNVSDIGDLEARHQEYAREVNDAVLDAGVELIALGIRADVSGIYSNSVRIQALDDLPREAVSQLDDLLRGNQTLRTSRRMSKAAS